MRTRAHAAQTASSGLTAQCVWPAGFKAQDSRVFTLDQNPPITKITTATVPYGGSKRAAQFAFAATDMLPVSSAPHWIVAQAVCKWGISPHAQCKNGKCSIANM